MHLVQAETAIFSRGCAREIDFRRHAHIKIFSWWGLISQRSASCENWFCCAAVENWLRDLGERREGKEGKVVTYTCGSCNLIFFFFSPTLRNEGESKASFRRLCCGASLWSPSALKLALRYTYHDSPDKGTRSIICHVTQTHPIFRTKLA